MYAVLKTGKNSIQIILNDDFRGQCFSTTRGDQKVRENSSHFYIV